MARDWRNLSTELVRVSTLLGAAGAATTPTPAVGLVAGLVLALGRLRLPWSQRPATLPDSAVMRARLRAAIEQGSRAGKCGFRGPTQSR